MKLITTIAIAAGLLAIAAAPALSAPPPQAGAYGKHCQGQSKKHIKGQKGTPFSQCVRAMAKLDNGETKSPRAACKDLSRKRVEGQKRSPFSMCVSAGAKLLRDKKAGRA
jgi:hypothetical protein